MNVTNLILFALALVAIPLAFYWYVWRSDAILQKWADENGYQIVDKTYRLFFKGPFFFQTSKHQTVYRVTVLDKTGRTLSGWVACGSYWWGLCSDQVQVRWDELTQATASKLHDRWLDD